MEACTKKQKIQDSRGVRRLLDKNSCLVQRVQPVPSAKHARRFHGRRRNEEAAKNEGCGRHDEENQIQRSKGRMDAENRWWVAELLAADCEKAWIHPEDEDTISFNWLEKWTRKMIEERWKNCTNKG